MADDQGFTVVDAPPSEPSSKTQSQCDRLIEAVQDKGAKFSPTSTGKVVATLSNGAREERYYVGSRAFEMKIRQIYGQAYPVQGKHGPRWSSVSSNALKEAISTFEAMALSSPICRPEIRSIWPKDAVWVDLGRDDWSLIRVTADGWSLEAQADVPLIRSEGMHPLPIPKSDPEAISKLRRLIRVRSEDDLRLTLAFLVAVLHPHGPYPILAVDEEQGSTKTTFCEILRRSVDPNEADLLAPPLNEIDLLITAQTNRLVALDNVSSIPPDLADGFCRLATGAALIKRRFYSDSDPTVLRSCRPVILSGITSLLTRGDLADRALTIAVPPLSAGERRMLKQVREAFAAAAPGILALLLDGLVMALRRMPKMQIAELPRMADFACLACAAAPVFGCTEGEMLSALERNRSETSEVVLEAEPIAWALRKIAANVDSKGWVGTATALMKIVNGMIANEFGSAAWRNPGRFSGRLQRIIPLLRRVGVEVTKYRIAAGGDRMIRIARISPGTKDNPPGEPRRRLRIIIRKKASHASDASEDRSAIPEETPSTDEKPPLPESTGASRRQRPHDRRTPR